MQPFRNFGTEDEGRTGDCRTSSQGSSSPKAVFPVGPNQVRQLDSIEKRFARELSALRRESCASIDGQRVGLANGQVWLSRDLVEFCPRAHLNASAFFPGLRLF